MHKSKDGIKLWTIQSPLAWEVLQEKGVLRSDGRRADKSFQHAYRWMKEQMAARMEDYQGHYPLWCWYTPKPDLRRKVHLNSGSEGIRVQFKVHPQKVLFSDFDSWHLVLNNQFLALTEEELENWEVKNQIFVKENQLLSLAEKLEQEKMSSWERIFDLELLNSSPLTGPVQNIQGVLEELTLDQVLNAQQFIAR